MLVTLHTVHTIDIAPLYIALTTSQASLANSCCIQTVFHKLATPTHWNAGNAATHWNFLRCAKHKNCSGWNFQSQNKVVALTANGEIFIVFSNRTLQSSIIVIVLWFCNVVLFYYSLYYPKVLSEFACCFSFCVIVKPTLAFTIPINNNNNATTSRVFVSVSQSTCPSPAPAPSQQLLFSRIATA